MLGLPCACQSSLKKEGVKRPHLNYLAMLIVVVVVVVVVVVSVVVSVVAAVVLASLSSRFCSHNQSRLCFKRNRIVYSCGTESSFEGNGWANFPDMLRMP